MAVTAVASAAQIPIVAVATSNQTWTITVSGDCENGAAVSDWQTVTGRDPRNALVLPSFAPGDTLRVVNQCDVPQSSPNNYVGELVLFDYPAAWSNPIMPPVVGSPTFSDGASWNVAPTVNDYSSGTINNGEHVDIVLGATTSEWIFERFIAAWVGGSGIFGGGAWYGKFAVLTPLDITVAQNSVTQVFGATTSAISTITLSYSGLGADGRILVDQTFPLPPGLSFSSQQVSGAYTSPATIDGTPTADGTYVVKFLAYNGTTGNFFDLSGNSLQIIVGPVISPATQTVSGQAGTAIASTTAFTASSFSGSVSYAVTGQTPLPAGLTLNASTGVISGTPTATSTDTVTIEATDGTNTATATVTFAITAAPAPPPPPPAAPVTTAPPTTAPPATLPNVPALINTDNQSTLTQSPGGATAIVNGEVVAVEVEAPADLPAAQKDPEDRGPAEVAALQDAAESLIDELNDVAGGNSGLSVVPSPTGASITGLMNVPVPIENTVIVKTDDQSTVFAALNQDGSVTEVQPGAQIEVLGNGQVGVAAFGLTPGETVEFVLMSTPTLLGRFEVDAQGGIKAQAQLPSSVGTGSHTLVVASPSVKASLGLRIGTPAAPTLPVTGGDVGDLAPVLLLLAVGAVLVIVSRRRITLVP